MPESLHAVSCSIPTMADVIGYEKKLPGTMRSICSGYPRFVTHRLLNLIAADWAVEHRLVERVLFLTPSARAAADLRAFAGPGGGVIANPLIHGVHYAAGSPAAARAAAYVQHTGAAISSRRAEDYLLSAGRLASRQPEERMEEGRAPSTVAGRLADLFGSPPDCVRTASSGMNAFHSVFRSLHHHQASRGRDLWVQLGWLYLDTIQILRKFTGGEDRRVFLPDVLRLDALRDFLEHSGRRVAAIVTEAPTNPLLRTPDLPALADVARRHGIPLVVDPTLASPRNVDVLSHCDVAVNSLTKYAASEGDVLGGGVILNPDSPWAETVARRLPDFLEPLYPADAARLAFEMARYDETVDRMNANALRVVERLSGHPCIRRIHWAYGEASRGNYERIQRHPNSPGCMLTLELKGELALFYDRARIPKGPSFGVRFTLLCPFMYLAHYDLVSTEQGRAYLRSLDLDPDLIRVSIGTEEPEEIISAFEEAL